MRVPLNQLLIFLVLLKIKMVISFSPSNFPGLAEELRHFKNEPYDRETTISTSTSIVHPSLFPHIFPPTIQFSLYTDIPRKLPSELTASLIWIKSNKIVTGAARRTGLTIRSFSQCQGKWFGFYSVIAGGKMNIFKVLTEPFQKYNIAPGAEELCHKDKMWRNFQKMAKRRGFEASDFLIESYAWPGEIFQFIQRQRFECKGELPQKWMYKSRHGVHSLGNAIFENLEIPHIQGKRQRAVLQHYIQNPYKGSFTRFRLYILQTGFSPIRAYVYNTGDTHLTPSFASRSPDNANIPNEDFLKILAKDGIDVQGAMERMEDIILKCLFSIEKKMADAQRQSKLNSYNTYQHWAADFIFDQIGVPWLLEFNRYQSFGLIYDSEARMKIHLVTETLNVAGYNFPPNLPASASQFIKEELHQHFGINDSKSPITFIEDLYSFRWNMSPEPSFRRKMKKFSNMFKNGVNRDEYLDNILVDLSSEDLRLLLISEDELSRTVNYKRIFPSLHTYRYLGFLESDPYPYMLQDAWENRFGIERESGIKVLRKLANKLL